MPKITVDLSPQQVHTFYEACGYMISAQGQKSIQERLIQDLMSYPNQAVGLAVLPMNPLPRMLTLISGIKSFRQPLTTLLFCKIMTQSR